VYDRWLFFFVFQAEDGIRDFHVTGVQTCALPIYRTVGSLMTMREDLVFINIKDDHNTIRQTVSEELHRIYPVYEQDKDNVIGVRSEERRVEKECRCRWWP